ncbi:MAG: acyl-CoA/acyl-ACP dehydrogenase [Candidatus Binatia bacterium]|nr:acyl-CoA/acyl-ACP dehydrogenase [Candidatus Binatia bacterium]
MDFGLNGDQALLAQSARAFLAKESPPALVRRLGDDPVGQSTDLNAKMTKQGWTGILVPKANGGLGLGMLDAAVLLTELGRFLAPCPFLSSAVLATSLLSFAGSASQKRYWLPRLACGEVLATVAWLEESDRLDPAGTALRARRARDRFRLSGSKLFVLDAHVADVYLVAARTSAGLGPEGVSLFAIPSDAVGLSVTPLAGFDTTRRLFEIKFDDVVVERDQRIGREGATWKPLQRMLDVGSVAIAAECQGGAERALEMAVDFAKIREQFGRPIGSFQAVKHMAADCFAEIEPSRSLLWYAAHAQQNNNKEASRAASMAKARLAEVYARATNKAVQMHGGIGFTWEHDMHFWFKRAKANEALFGSPAFHRERIAALSGW